MIIYLVARHFKSNGKYYQPGDIIESPADIKRFKIKLGEGKIVGLERHSPNTLKTIRHYEAKFGKQILSNVKAFLAKQDTGASTKVVDTPDQSNE